MNDNSDRGILAAVQKMTGTYNLDQIYLVTGTCSNINEAAGTCDVEAISGNAATTVSAVKFQAAIGDGIDFIPIDGSIVKVLFSKYTTPFIVQFSDIEKMFFAATTIQFNDGALGGLVNVIDLTTKLNNLENAVNSIISNFNSHTHVVASVGAPTAPPAAPIFNTLQTTSRGDIEDKNITH